MHILEFSSLNKSLTPSIKVCARNDTSNRVAQKETLEKFDSVSLAYLTSLLSGCFHIFMSTCYIISNLSIRNHMNAIHT